MEIYQSDASNQKPPRGVDPEQLTGLEWNALRTEQWWTGQRLQRGRTPLTLVDVADHAAKLAEEAVRWA
jgi:hypothetical protein